MAALVVPIDRAALATPEEREAALDVVARWFTEELAARPDDEARCRAVMCAAIEAFYDIREAANAPRGMYAGHFFLVDAVGLDDTDRPVPWSELARGVTPAQLERLHGWFDAAERATR